MSDPNAFIINRLRKQPVTYSVEISHYVSGGKWVMGLQVHDIAQMDERSRESIAADLRLAATLVEQGGWISANDTPEQGK